MAFSRRDRVYVTVLTGFRGPQLSVQSSEGSAALKRLRITGLGYQSL